MSKPFEAPLLDQSVIDYHLASRTLSDAELLNGGAEFHNSQLHATKEQIEGIRLANPLPTGWLSLRDPKEEQSLVVVDTLISNESRRGDFTSIIAEIVRPYSYLFDEFTPQPSKRDVDMFGRLRSEAKLEPWTLEFEGYNQATTYTFGGKYIPSSKHNRISEISMDIGLRGNSEARTASFAKIDIGLSQANIDVIRLKTKDYSSALNLRNFVNDQAFTRFMQQRKLDHGGVIEFDLTNTPRLSGQSLTWRRGFDYALKDGYDTLPNGMPEPIIAPDSMTIAEFEHILRAVLGLLPTKQT